MYVCMCCVHQHWRSESRGGALARATLTARLIECAQSYIGDFAAVSFESWNLRKGMLPRIPLEQGVATCAGRGLRGSCSLWPLITGLALIAGPHSVIAGHSWSVLLFYGFFYARMASIRHSWSVLLLFGLFYAARRSHLYSVLQ